MFEYTFLVVIMFSAGFVQGLAGFGFSLIGVPLASLLLNVKHVVPLCVLLGMITMIILAIQLKGHLDLRRLRALYLGLLPGIGVGTLLLKHLPDHLVEMLLGTFLIILSLYNFFGHRRIKKLHPLWGAVAGFLSGSISASVGGGGPPVVVYASISGWPRDEMKAVLASFFVGMTTLTVVAHALGGLISSLVLKLLVISSPAALLGLALGSRCYGRLDSNSYRRLLYVILCILGVMLLVRSF